MKPKHATSIRLICAGLLALSATLPARADYQSGVLSQAPLGYWRLNETKQPPNNGTTANLGALGATANGHYTGSPTYQLAGPFTGSTAVGFDGVSASVITPFNAGLNPNAFSVELWVNPASASTFAYVAASAHLASPRSGWYLAQDNGNTFGHGKAYVVRMFYQNGTTPAITLWAPNGPAGVWEHLVLTFDGTNATIYTNGVAAMTGIPTGFVGNVDTETSFGCRSDNAFFWPGEEAEVAMYTGALSSTRIAAHYNAAINTPGSYVSTVQADAPVLYYRFPEASSVVAADIGSLGSSANGIYQYGTTPDQTGPRPPQYPVFDAGNNAVSVPGTGPSVVVPALNLNTNAVTITCWLKATTNTEVTGAGIIFCDVSGSPSTVAGLTVDSVYGGLGLGYVWNNDPNTYEWSPSVDAGLPALPYNDWAFVALVVQPTEADLYICASNNPANFAAATNLYGHVLQAFSGPTFFGSDDGQASLSYNGLIDEVAIFNQSLGEGEVYSQYAAAIGGLGPQIFVQPQAPVDPVYTGDTLTIVVDAGGTPNLSYQWHNTSGPIIGATNNVYTKVNVKTTDSDTYSCVITNLYGNVTSAGAVITVNQAFQPAIITPPTGHTLYPGGTINLTVVAEGGGLRYQWLKSNTNIIGANSASYVVPRVTTNDAGSYSVIVSNNVGSIGAGPVTITVLTPVNSYETAIVADAPEAWFRLNETSGTTMFDSMGRHDGYYTNQTGSPVTLGTPGAIVGSSDTAVTFPGPNGVSYGIAPYSPLLNGNMFSIECWAQTSDLSDNLAAVSSHSGINQGYGVWTVPSGNWSGLVGSGGTDYYVGSSTAQDGIVPGKYAHIVMVYDTALKIYVDGEWDGVAYVNFDRNPSAPFIVGALGGTSVNSVFNGQVDEVLVYTNALTLAQAQNHYSLALFPNPIPPFWLVLPTSDEVVSNALASITLTGQAGGPQPITYQWFKNGVAVSGGTNTTLVLSCVNSNAGSYVLQATNPYFSTNAPPAIVNVLPVIPSSVNVTNGLVLHLRFDGNYQDSSGRGHNGTPTGSNAVPSFVAGRIGSGAVSYFTDTSTGEPANLGATVVTNSSYVTLGNPADLQFSSNVDFSVSYWVKLPVGYANGDLPFFCSAVNSTFNTGFTFAPGYTNGSFGFSYNGIGIEGSQLINDGNWHHLLHTISRTGSVYVYLDGAQVDARLATGIGDMTTPGPVNIGQDPTGLYPEQGSADLDDLAVWRRSLTSYEAYAVYYAATNSNSSFDIPAPVALKISHTGTNVVISWSPGATLGTLMQADNVRGPWTPVGVYVPTYQVPPGASKKFYRLSLSE